jgi:hypothetical protein
MGERQQATKRRSPSPPWLLRGPRLAVAAVVYLGDWAWSLPVALAAVAVALS